MTVAYFRWLHVDPDDPAAPGRDRFVLARQDALPTLFAALGDAGFLGPSQPEDWAGRQGRLAEEPMVEVPGVEAGAEAFGHGLAVATGMAFAADLRSSAAHRTVVLLGDDEFEDPSTDAVAARAVQSALDNVVAVAFETERARSTPRHRRRWAGLGWTVLETVSATIDEIARTLDAIPDPSRTPTLVIVSGLDDLA